MGGTEWFLVIVAILTGLFVLWNVGRVGWKAASAIEKWLFGEKRF